MILALFAYARGADTLGTVGGYALKRSVQGLHGLNQCDTFPVPAQGSPANRPENGAHRAALQKGLPIWRSVVPFRFGDRPLSCCR